MGERPDVTRMPVLVLCHCCRHPEQTCDAPAFDERRRSAEVWRCGDCGEPCTNRLCPSMPTEVL